MSTEPEDTGADLRALLHETAAGITPQGSLDEIKERIVTESNPRRWILPTLAAAAAMVLVVGGIGWMLRDDDSSSDAPPAAVTADPVPTAVYYAGVTTFGRSLFRETHDVAAVTGGEDAGKANPLEAINETMHGTPLDPDYSSLWPAALTATATNQDDPGTGKRITVELTGPAATRPAGMTERDATLAILAVARTAEEAWAPELSDSPGVAFVGPDGQELETVLGLASGEWGPGDDDTYLAPVQITSLVDGQTVPVGDLIVTGEAATFEANVVWELLVGGDAVADSGFTTADECCTLAPYTFTVKNLQPGTYTLVAHDTDESGEGRATNQDTKEIVVE